MSKLLVSSDWTSLHSLWATGKLESVVKYPFGSRLDGVVKDIGQEGDRCEAKLKVVVSKVTHTVSVFNLSRKKNVKDGLTPIGPQVLIVLFFASFNALPEYLTMLWIVKAGSPIEATAWNTALCAITAL